MKQLIHAQTLPGVLRPVRLSEPEIYADREAQHRSGHVGHGLAEFAPGKIIDFAPNTSAVRLKGHAAFGWMEYRISEDWGRSFSEPRKLPFSWETFLNGINTVSVEKVAACSDGSITAFCLMNSTRDPVCCEPWSVPMRVRSTDGGESWSEASPVTSYAGRIYDVLVRDDVIYVLEFCNDADKTFTGWLPEHVYRLFRSTDRGVSFEEVCVVPFPDTKGRGYGNMIFTPEGELLVYAYNVDDEQVMDVMRSPDRGASWLPAEKSFVAKKIRNPQVGLLDGQYVLHGRAGENEQGGSGSMVIYFSADGVHWDEGTILVSGRPACFYSNNLTLRCPDGKERMLVQYSENYHDPIPLIDSETWTATVNTMHFWLESL